MAANEFAGRTDFDFAVGEVYGLRMWSMDIHGRLRARNWNKAGPWRPGVNTATCLADTATSPQNAIDPTGRDRAAVEIMIDYDWGLSAVHGASIAASYPKQRYRVYWDDGSTEVYSNLKFKDSTPHPAPTEGCSCGFYAYTSPTHEDAQLNPGDRRVLGIIRGTGRTLIGSKGFRCEKAEIIALLDPTRGGRKHADWRREQRAFLARLYPDVPLLDSRYALVEFAPLTDTMPDPTSDEFWTMA